MAYRGITFDDKFAVPIINGDKTATVRSGGYADVHYDHALDAVLESGRKFATLRVTRTAEVNAIEAYRFIKLVGAKHGAKHQDDLIERLNEYYDGINPGSTVKVIVFETIDD